MPLWKVPFVLSRDKIEFLIITIILSIREYMDYILMTTIRANFSQVLFYIQ